MTMTTLQSKQVWQFIEIINEAHEWSIDQGCIKTVERKLPVDLKSGVIPEGFGGCIRLHL